MDCKKRKENKMTLNEVCEILKGYLNSSIAV